MLTLIEKIFYTPEEESSDSELHYAAAALLIHVSIQDENFCSSERSELEMCLTEHFYVDKDDVDEVLSRAEQELEDSVDLHVFTRQLAKEYDYEQRKDMVRLLWRIAFADNKIDYYENVIISKIANLLDVTVRDRVLLKQEVEQGL
jgi:uncharacterized tellurite resistance protein B-like protein